MKAILFDDFEVDINPRSLDLGGSWSAARRHKPPRAWEPDNIRFFYGKIKQKEEPLILDIGASTGSYCLLAKFHPMTVLAFEPVPEVYGVLCNNIVRNKLVHLVSTQGMALSDKKEETWINVPERDDTKGLACLGVPTRFSKWRRVKVTTRRLDSYDLAPDFIKMDVEGWEMQVIRGAKKMLGEYKPPILMESAIMNSRNIAFNYKPGELQALLESYGYTGFQKVGKEDVWVT